MHDENGEGIEGDDNISSRRLRDRERVAQARLKETPEQRVRRLEANRIRTQLSRQQASDEEKALRREKDRLRISYSRHNETEEQKRQRLDRDRYRTQVVRQTETPEQRTQRLSRNREYMKVKRDSKTPEERILELQRRRNRYQATKNEKTLSNDGSQHDPEYNEHVHYDHDQMHEQGEEHEQNQEYLTSIPLNQTQFDEQINNENQLNLDNSNERPSSPADSVSTISNENIDILNGSINALVNDDEIAKKQANEEERILMVKYKRAKRT